VSELVGLEEVWELDRPVVAATERLRTVVEELKVERTRAVGDLRRAVLNLGHDCPPEQRAELARVLYWRHTEVPIITVAFGYDQSTLLSAVGTVRTRATCEDCDAKRNGTASGVMRSGFEPTITWPWKRLPFFNDESGWTPSLACTAICYPSSPCGLWLQTSTRWP
jgi:hypothetical protein